MEPVLDGSPRLTAQSDHMSTQGALYTTLTDASTFIRLLYIRDAVQETSPITFEMTEHPVDSIPPYAAISYVWGSSNKRHRLSINGNYMYINDNARFALDQACNFNRKLDQDDSGDAPIWYIWMDTVCINQQDLCEKSSQVEMMADIYFNAADVYACIGHREDGSELLLEVFDAIRDVYSYNQAIRSPQQNCYTHFTGEFDYSIAVEWLLSQDEDHLSNICEAYAKMAHRPYWSRMWIVQELCMGQNCLVLCGPDNFTLSDLRLLESVFDDLLDVELPVEWRFQIEATWGFVSEGYMGRAIQSDLWSPNRLGAGIAKMKDFKCYDPRDRVYALNAMIKWGEGQPRLKPDYTKSAFDVLVDAVGHVRPSPKTFPETFSEMAPFGVLEALGIEASQPQMQDEVAKRRECPSSVEAKKPATSTVLVRECSYAFARIARDQQARLTARFHQVKEDETQECKALLCSLDAIERSATALNGIFEGRKPQRLFADAAVIGLVCQAAQDGDYLYPFDVPRAVANNTSQVYVVLRCNDSAKGCTIVGQAVIFGHYEPSVRFPTWSEFEDSEYTMKPSEPMLELILTAKDVVVLMGQDFAVPQATSTTRYPETPPSLRSKIDTGERFKRIITAVTTCRESGARLVLNPSTSEELCALNIATSFAHSSKLTGRRERDAFLISQTQTGFVFMKDSIPIRHFSGPFIHTSGDLCPVHGSGPPLQSQLRETAVFERSAQPLSARQVECSCHRRG